MAEEAKDEVTPAKKCKNTPCACQVEKGEQYCSVHCQSVENTIQMDCDCGHEACFAPPRL